MSERIAEDEMLAMSIILNDDPVEQEQKSETVVIEMENITRSVQFTPFSKENTTVDGDRHEMPIRGSGEVDGITIISQSNQFSIRFEIDNTIVYDDSFTTLEAISPELNRIDAYSYNSDSEHLIAIAEYEFNEYMNIHITPDENDVTFDRVRVEVEVDNELA